MARNKHPEETVRKILEISTRLFLEKGYEKTTMQDIISALGMSKGAVYHHFSSKEALMEAVVERYYSQEEWFHEIVEDRARNGLEKLRAVVLHEISHWEKLEMDALCVQQTADAGFTLKNLQQNLRNSAREISALVEEGNRDGSLRVENPQEAIEMMLILLNVWISYFADTREKFIRQLKTLGTALEALGIPLINREIETQFLAYYDRILCQVEQ